MPGSAQCKVEIRTLLILRLLSSSNAQECKKINENHLNPVMLVFIRYYLLLYMHSYRPNRVSSVQGGDNNPSHAEGTFIVQCTRMQKKKEKHLNPVMLVFIRYYLLLFIYFSRPASPNRVS